MPRKSRYVIIVENLSSMTRSNDIKREFEYCGPVYEVERDAKSRSALVEMKKAADADYAWKKLDGITVDGRRWKIDYATKDDFKFFNWKWTEDTPERSRSPSSSRSRSPSPGTPRQRSDDE